ncbi:hypothetical protein HKX48_001377 [Thoreauomyces humboldtii]|nr:hypothetical protein HKX48_001377 [Thoreauomyces humboldtii]
MTPEQVLAMDPREMGERLQRLKKFESKFQELARVYKLLQRKLQQIEGIIGAHSPIPKISSTADLEALDAFLTSLREKQDVSVAEIGRLTRQVSEGKEVSELEASTKADMFSSMQTKLLEREEEINRLKRALGSSETPPGSPRLGSRGLASPATVETPAVTPSESSVALKLKLRELTAALKRTTEERDKAIDKSRLLEFPVDVQLVAAAGSEVARSQDKTDDFQTKLAERLQGETAVALEEERSRVVQLKAERDSLAASLEDLRIAQQARPDDSPSLETQQNPAELLSEQESLQEALGLAVQRRETVEQELAASAARVAQLEASLEDSQALGATLASALATLEDNLTLLTAEKAKLEDRQQILQTEPNASGEPVLPKKAQKQANKEKNALLARVSDLEEQLKQRNEVVAQLSSSQERLEAASSDLEAAEKEKAVLTVEISKLRDMLSTQEKSTAILEEDKRELEARSMEADTLAAEKQSLADRLRECEHELAQQLTSMGKIKVERDTALILVAELREQAKNDAGANLEHRLLAVSAELEAAQITVAETTAKLYAAVQCRDDSLKRVHELEATVTENQGNVDRVQNLMKVMREKLQSKIVHSEAEIEELKAKAVTDPDLESQLVALKEELETKASRIEELEHQLAGANEASPAMAGPPEKNKGRAKLEKQLAALRVEVAKLNAQVEAGQAEQAVLQRQASLAEEAVADRDESLSALQRETVALRLSLKTIEDERSAVAIPGNAEAVSKLESRVAQINEQAVQLQAQLAAAEDQLRIAQEASKQDHFVFETKERQMREELTQAATAIQTAAAKLADLENGMALLAAEKDELFLEQQNHGDLVASHERANIAVRKQFEEAAAKLRGTEEELQALRQELEAFGSQLADEQANSESLQKELQIARDNHSSALRSIADLTSRLSDSADHTAQIDDLIAERAALLEEVKEASLLREKIATSESRAEQLEKDMKSLTIVRRQLELVRTETEQRLRVLEESLALAKQSIHERDSAAHDLEAELASTRFQLRDEEEKKVKSIQLLRQSKARILKLEAESKGKDELLGKVHEELRLACEARDHDVKEKEAQLSNVTRQIEDMQTRMRRQQEAAGDLERQRQEFAAEKGKIHARLEELENLESRVRAERDNAWEELEMKHGELESARSMLEAREAQLAGEVGRWTGVEDRMGNIEHELETSKKLFQSKSTENDQLRLRVSELEAQVYDATQASGRFEGDLDTYKREAREARKSLADRTEDVKRLENEIQKAREDVHAAEEHARGLELLEREAQDLRAQLAKHNQEVSLQEVERERRVAELNAQLDSLNAEKASIQKDTEEALFNRDKLLEDMRIREGQLKNLNKTLKDEVRKLTRTASSNGLGGTPTSSSLQSPPPISRPPSAGSLNGGRHSHHGSIGSLGSDDGSRRDSLASRPTLPSRGPSLLGAVDASANVNAAANAANSTNGGAEGLSLHLKAVLLKFLEAKDKRNQLLPVLGMLLQFSPDELKRMQKFV